MEPPGNRVTHRDSEDQWDRSGGGGCQEMVGGLVGAGYNGILSDRCAVPEAVGFCREEGAEASGGGSCGGGGSCFACDWGQWKCTPRQECVRPERAAAAAAAADTD